MLPHFQVPALPALGGSLAFLLASRYVALGSELPPDELCKTPLAATVQPHSGHVQRILRMRNQLLFGMLGSDHDLKFGGLSTHPELRPWTAPKEQRSSRIQATP